MHQRYSLLDSRWAVHHLGSWCENLAVTVYLCKQPLFADSTSHVANGTAEGADDEDDAEMQRGQPNLTAEQGLKHLLLTVDVERLYRQVPLHQLLATILP